MPCYDVRDDWDKELDSKGAGLLCELIKAGKVNPGDSKALALWWQHHQDKDAFYLMKSQR